MVEEENATEADPGGSSAGACKAIQTTLLLPELLLFQATFS